MIVDSRELSDNNLLLEIISIDEIVINERIRSEINYQKVEQLKESIIEVGLIHPITISFEKVLIAGQHRLLACQSIGWNKIPCQIINSDDPLALELLEIDENLIRAELHFLERGKHLARRKIIYEKKYPETRNGQVQALAMNKKLGNDVKELSSSTFSKTISEKLGVTPRTINEEIQISRDILPEVQEVIKEREIGKKEALLIAREEHEVQEKIIEKLVTGTSTVKIALIKIRREEKPAHTPKLPSGIFDIILADPAWKYDFYVSENRSPENHYRTMELEDICQIKIPAARDSVLFLWATTAKLDWAMKVIEAWGFTFKTSMVWIKDKIGMGHYVRNQHEFVLIATKGFPGIPLPSTRPSSVFHSPRTQHSKKPAIIHDLIEQMYPNRDYLELFARESRENWTAWGNEL